MKCKFICLMPSYDLNGCAGECLKYINDMFDYCKYLEVEEDKDIDNS